jgi:hypothetical protein
MSLSLRCAARSRRSRSVINLVSNNVLVEPGIHDLGSFATLVVPELGEEGMRKYPIAQVVEGLYSIHAHPRPR